MLKLWTNKEELNPQITAFTIGNDPEMDIRIAKWDVIGSIAHTMMLEECKLIETSDSKKLINELKRIHKEIENGTFLIENGVEDVHSQIELVLSNKLGESGKKIHTARSRNDQVLVDLRMYMRNEIFQISKLMKTLFDSFLSMSEEYKKHLMPGYTHLQIAMPSSFGLWFASFAESLADDLIMLESVYRLINRSPLGSAAGYGSSFPIKREITAKLLGFDDLNFNVIYAQSSRVKVEMAVMSALTSLASTIAKFAADACLFMSQNYNFIGLPDDFTTGSSIMPHKKNPDIFELLRAKSNVVKSNAFQWVSLSNNLTTGYFRDYQILKEPLFSTFDITKEILSISNLVLNQMEVRKDIMKNPLYQSSFSVEAIEQRVRNGEAFRTAYHDVMNEIKNGKLQKSENIRYTLEGSMGNLCNEQIRNYFSRTLRKFHFTRVEKAIEKLLSIDS